MIDDGTRTVDEVLYTNVNVTIDSDYACGLFTSCAKESYIAVAGIDSAVAFLDFMGSNGAPYSISYINFNLQKESTLENGMLGAEDSEWFPCEYEVPDDGVILGYTGIYNSTCSYCDAACSPPVVNDDIGFLDGLSWKLVGFTYLGFIIFTILFQVVMHLCCKKQNLSKMKAQVEAYESGEGLAQGGAGTLGKPLNVTDSNNNSAMLS